ncbi:hypothetical protein TSUD_243080 [Trifolium subterraneum]|uniref:non-specific serine/threonine protein kinase n=1 Tax=Trifolium subterraneum TaxID=3900 RepID=A0A2Z6NL20_TRISU|nr:hypothetical protein TSUD_243080 [Trifolium subterraneum]
MILATISSCDFDSSFTETSFSQPLGSFLQASLTDTMIRWRRMSGYNTLWVPGMDHAGIATQNKGSWVALVSAKRMILTQLLIKESSCKTILQVSIVSRLKHENVVELVTYCVDGPLRALAYETQRCEGCRTWSSSDQVLTWAQRVKIVVGAARGLEYLHEKAEVHIVHRYIKSSNILLFEDDVAKIADFDLSNQAPDAAARLHSTRVLGTFGYYAPE